MLLFSGAHLHASVPNTSGKARFSVDFRTVDVADLLADRGALLVDVGCTGTAIRDFRRVADDAPFEEEWVRERFGVPPSGSTLVFPEPRRTAPVSPSPSPRLSVGLPVFNGERVICEALDALLGQTFEDFELIVSDNGSTDGTSDACREYAARDTRVRYIRQPRNIGLVPNHIFVMEQARGEFFKWAAHDDLYARHLLERCVQALDEDPGVVLADSWSAMIDSNGIVIGTFEDRVVVDAPRTPDRFRSMLFDGWDDYTYGVIRTRALRHMTKRGSYHFADRTLNAELALYGRFSLVPEWLYFRREHAGRPSLTVRDRCAILDPRPPTGCGILWFVSMASTCGGTFRRLGGRRSRLARGKSATPTWHAGSPPGRSRSPGGRCTGSLSVGGNRSWRRDPLVQLDAVVAGRPKEPV